MKILRIKEKHWNIFERCVNDAIDDSFEIKWETFNTYYSGVSFYIIVAVKKRG